MVKVFLMGASLHLLIEVGGEARPEEHRVPLSAWKGSPADFADCLIGARNRTLGCRATASFDVKARESRQGQVKAPKVYVRGSLTSRRRRNGLELCDGAVDSNTDPVGKLVQLDHIVREKNQHR